MVPKPDTGRAGVVLAAGRRTRVDRIDVTTTFDGEPLVRCVVEAVDPAVDHLVVSCRSEQRATLEAALAGWDVTFAEAAFFDRGPAAGLRAGLRATEAEYAAVVAADSPFVPSGFLEFLFAQARTHSGAVPTFDGEVRPLPAAVHVRAATAACTEALTRGDGSLGDAVEALDPRVIPERSVRAHVSADAFYSVTSWGDLRAPAGRR